MSRLQLRHHPSSPTSNRLARPRVIFGVPATGPTERTVIFGFPARGLRFLSRDTFGLLVTGLLRVATIIWHGGYWGPHVGYYGGINYGYGYYGSGFYGGRWDGNVFRYNTAVWHVNSAVIHNTYVDRTVINHETVNNHVSFNGPGGIETRPTAAEEAAAQNRRLEATPAQRAHEQEARNDRNQHYSVNHGPPEHRS